VVQKIVLRYGGRIWFTSTLGEGTTFHFTLGK
jgi:signal transduction histidine kinase